MMFAAKPNESIGMNGVNDMRTAEASKERLGVNGEAGTMGGMGGAHDQASEDGGDARADVDDLSTFQDLDRKFAFAVPNPTVRKVAQLCFASLAAVFIRSAADGDENGAKKSSGPSPADKGGGPKKSSSGDLKRVTSFPMESAFMLWEELLSLNRANAVVDPVKEQVRTQHRYTPGNKQNSLRDLLKGNNAAKSVRGQDGHSRGGGAYRDAFATGMEPEGYGDDDSDDLHAYLDSDDETELVDAPLDGEDDDEEEEGSFSHSSSSHAKYITKAEFAEFVDEVVLLKSSKLWKALTASSLKSTGESTHSMHSNDSRSEPDKSGGLNSDNMSDAMSTKSDDASTSSRGGRSRQRRRSSIGSVTRPTVSLAMPRRLSDPAVRALKDQSGSSPSPRPPREGPRPPNEELLGFIRDLLIELGLLAKVPGSVETFYVTEDGAAGDKRFDNASPPVANRPNFPRMISRFGIRGVGGRVGNSSDSDKNAAQSQQSSMLMVVERKKEKEFTLSIKHESHFRYGLHLSTMLLPSMARRDGADEYDAGIGGNSGNDDNKVQDFSSFKSSWNSLMADACVEKSKRNKQRLQESLKKQFDALDDSPRQERRKNDCHLETYGERFYFACELAADSRTILIDDATIHSLRMLPTYLMRSLRVVEAATLLSCTGFARGRVMVLGVEEAAKWHRLDCAELQRSVMESDRKEVDEKGATIAAYNTMMTCLMEKESSYGLSTRHMTSQRHMTESHKEISRQVGKAFHAMGLSASKQGFLKLSVECYKEALSAKKAVYGPDDVTVAATLHNMGNVYLSKGWYRQATECYEEVLRVQKLKLGDKHKKVCVTLHSLGTVYGMTGEYAKAIRNYQDALLLEKVRYGDDQLPVAKTLNSIGIIHGMNGCYSDAVNCYRESLRIKRLKLGFNDEEVASTLFNLGIVQSKNGQYKEAILSYKEALRIRKMLLGDDHEDVARILHYIGTVHADLGEYDDAILNYEDALRIRKSKLGPYHEDVARTLHNLGLAHDQNNDDEKAMDFFDEALRVARRNFGMEHEKVADTLHRMGVVCNKTGKYDEALEYYDEALRIRRLKLGDDHLDVAATFHNLGDVYYVMNSYDQAMECYEKALQVRRAKLGNENAEVAATLNNMGVVFLRRGQNNYAIDCYKEALKVRKLRLGSNHEKCADTLHNIGLVYKNMAEHDLAMEHYSEALRVRKLTLGNKHPKVADTLYNMGIVYSNSGQYEEALECYEGALTTYRAAEVGTDHPSVVNTMDWITWIKKQLETPLA